PDKGESPEREDAEVSVVVDGARPVEDAGEMLSRPAPIRLLPCLQKRGTSLGCLAFRLPAGMQGKQRPGRHHRLTAFGVHPGALPATLDGFPPAPIPQLVGAEE